MKQAELTKSGPLTAIYRQRGIPLTDLAGWRIAEHFGDPESEKRNLQTGSLLADWSHIGKISLYGRGAAAEAVKMDARAAGLDPLRALGTRDTALLRLVEDEFLILCQAGMEDSVLRRFDEKNTVVLNETGALACFALGGKRRDEVLERSTAMDLRRDRVGIGSTVRTTVHTIPCTIFRTRDLDILVHPRDFSQSLFEGLLDVGQGVGLVPSGIASLPVLFDTGE
jgi:heterotetrameric sarcosine oxidase gamma subunit